MLELVLLGLGLLLLLLQPPPRLHLLLPPRLHLLLMERELVVQELVVLELVLLGGLGLDEICLWGRGLVGRVDLRTPLGSNHVIYAVLEELEPVL